MSRNERLVILLSGSEREAIKRLAATERLPESTMARAILLKEADAKGSGGRPQEGRHAS
jgi:hypothetical protein